MSSRSKALQYYILVRLLLAPLMLWTIFTVAFLLLRATPGDPVDAVLTLSKCDRANSFPDAIALILLKCDRTIYEKPNPVSIILISQFKIYTCSVNQATNLRIKASFGCLST